jgi:hypothetical protein
MEALLDRCLFAGQSLTWVSSPLLYKKCASEWRPFALSQLVPSLGSPFGLYSLGLAPVQVETPKQSDTHSAEPSMPMPQARSSSTLPMPSAGCNWQKCFRQWPRASQNLYPTWCGYTGNTYNCRWTLEKAAKAAPTGHILAIHNTVLLYGSPEILATMDVALECHISAKGLIQAIGSALVDPVLGLIRSKIQETKHAGRKYAGYSDPVLSRLFLTQSSSQDQLGAPGRLKNTSRGVRKAP